VLVRILPSGTISEADWNKHPSEQDLDDYPHDHYITSTRGDIKGLLQQVDAIVEGL
jgi:hypothetical protein